LSSLIVIGGPNGAGKSTTSTDLLKEYNIRAFDFDKVYYELWAQFDYDPLVGQGARDRTVQIFDDLKNKAIEAKENFAFETNLNDSALLLPHLKQFKDSGYSLRLAFIFLETVEMAIGRVKQRIAEKGHGVPEDQIRQRYANGLKVLDENFLLFDRIDLYKSIENDVIHLISFLPFEKQIFNERNGLPQTVKDKLPNLVKFIDSLRL
jgi:predicted ABC-type ATPase